MLKITQQLGRAIRVGKDIIIVPIRVKGNKVRLGIHAAPEIRIKRDDAFNLRVWEERRVEKKRRRCKKD